MSQETIKETDHLSTAVRRPETHSLCNCDHNNLMERHTPSEGERLALPEEHEDCYRPPSPYSNACKTVVYDEMSVQLRAAVPHDDNIRCLIFNGKKKDM
jgi:hypothetical protein